MIKYISALVLIGSIGFGCSNASKSDKVTSQNNTEVGEKEYAEGLKLLQQKCYACHSVATKSHDEIIAPPMIAVKTRYKVEYSTKEEFVNAFVEWTANPTKEKALMFGAVTKFNVMPKQEFDKNEIRKIAEYIYDNEIEKPDWFEAHFKVEHPEGMGKFKGRNSK